MLQVDKAALEKEKGELTAQRDQFENSLQLIQQFTNFPVSTYCTLTKNSKYKLIETYNLQFIHLFIHSVIHMYMCMYTQYNCFDSE